MILLFGRINVLKIKPLAQYQPHKWFHEERPALNNKRAHFEGISHLGNVLTVVIH